MKATPTELEHLESIHLSVELCILVPWILVVGGLMFFPLVPFAGMLIPVAWILMFPLGVTGLISSGLMERFLRKRRTVSPFSKILPRVAILNVMGGVFGFFVLIAIVGAV